MEELIEKYDVMGVIGNGASLDIQKEAGVKEADLVIALTRNDELNIFACLVAKFLGCTNTVARVRNPDYRRQIGVMKKDLGISMIVNPEKETAREILNLINLPSAARVEYFANGKAILVETIVNKDSLLAGESLLSLGQKLTSNVLICAVQRENKIYIPSGNFVIQEGDKIHFTSDIRNLNDFLRETNLLKSPLKNIMIVGGGRIGYYLADALAGKKYTVKLIEKNMAKAQSLAQLLPNVSAVEMEPVTIFSWSRESNPQMPSLH